MAVSTTNAISGPYTTNGATTVFPFSFTAPSVSEVAVYLRDGTGEVSTAGSGDYTVALTAGGGGSVTFDTAPVTGYSLYVVLAPDFTQDIQFENGSAWLAEPVNEANDRAAARDQYLKARVDLLAPEHILAGARQGRYLAWDADGDPVFATGTGADAGLREDLAESTGAALVGHQAEDSTLTRSAATVMDEFVFASGFTGYDESGATDSYAAIMAADAVARDRRRTLILAGTPLIMTPIVLTLPTQWRMEGQMFKPGFANPTSAILKHSSINGPALTVLRTALQSTLDGVAIYGQPGNGGDGFYIVGDRVTLNRCVATGMGQDGCRIGAYAAGGAGEFNADSFRLIGCSFGYNTRDGLHIDDLSGVTNANAGTVETISCAVNGRHGIYINNAYLGNTFLCPLIEGNGAWGLYLDASSAQNIFMGGDIEGNTTGDLFQHTLYKNTFYDMVVLGSRYSNFAENAAFTPAAIGSTAAGVGTYTAGQRRGLYSVVGRRLFFDIELVWTAHTGTGDLRVSGFPLAANTISADIPNDVPCAVTYSVPLAAGETLSAAFNHNLGQVVVYKISSTGVRSALALPAAGTLYLSGSYIPSWPS